LVGFPLSCPEPVFANDRHSIRISHIIPLYRRVFPERERTTVAEYAYDALAFGALLAEGTGSDVEQSAPLPHGWATPVCKPPSTSMPSM
jgi:hypothetical protein